MRNPVNTAREAATSSSEPVRRVNRFIWRLAGLCVALIVLCGSLGLSLLGYRQSGKYVATCDAWRIVATSPITPTSSQALLRLVVAGRNAYDGIGCPAKHGKLPAPDERVKPYLHLGR